MNNIEKEKPVNSVCYQCGSFDIALLNQQDGKRVFKCQTCGKIWIKMDVFNYGKKHYF